MRPADSLERQTYDAVRQALREKFAPGDWISAPAVARQLGVSRTPVVQAFQTLIAEGFLTMEPRKGVRVAKPNAAEIRERYLVLIALEGLCATEAFRLAPRDAANEMRLQLAKFRSPQHSFADESEIDRVFHEILWKHSKLPNVAAQLALLWERGAYYRLMLFQATEHRESRYAEHEAMVVAAENGDLVQFVDALTQHRRAGMARMQALLTSAPSEARGGLGQPA